MDTQIFEKIKEELKKYFREDFYKFIVHKNFYRNIENLYEDLSIKDNIIVYNLYEIQNRTSIVKRIYVPKDITVIIYDEIRNHAEVSYKVLGKIEGEIYHITRVDNLKSYSRSNVEKRFVSYKKTYNVSKVYIPESSENSEGIINEIFLKKGGEIITIPLIYVGNKTSKGFHGSKIVRLDSDQIFYLTCRGLKDTSVHEVLEKSILSI